MKLSSDQISLFVRAAEIGAAGGFEGDKAIEIHTNDEEIMRAAAFAINQDEFKEAVKEDPTLLIFVGLLADEICQFLIKKQEERNNGIKQ